MKQDLRSDIMKRLPHLLRLFGAITITGALLLATGFVQAETLYKYLGSDGKTVYSDKPPPKGVKFEKLEPNTAPTGVTLLPNGSAGSTSDQEMAAAADARRAKETAHADTISTLQKNLEAATAALEAAKEPREGERVQNTNGTSRLTDDYFQRIEAAQKQVDDAQKQLDDARRG
jgi:hypothetical protein